MDHYDTDVTTTDETEAISKSKKRKICYKEFRDVLEDMIELYRDCPCLWNHKNPLFKNQQVRMNAWQSLVPLWKKIDPCCNLVAMKKKMENLRTNFLKEYKKVKESISSGAIGKEVYQPTLWYFNHMLFLISDQIQFALPDLLLENKNQQISELPNSISEDDEEPITSRDITSTVVKHEINETNESNNESDNLQDTENLLLPPIESCEAFGQYIGPQLKEMSKFQRCIAEKLISDVIFYGKLDKLTLHSSINLTQFTVASSRSPSPSMVWVEPS